MPNQRDDGKVFLGWWALSATRERLEALTARRGITKTDALNEAANRYLDEADLSRFRVAGFDDEGMSYTQPVEVSCGQCGEAQAFTWRDDGGADYTESLPVLVAWAAGHQCKEHPE